METKIRKNTQLTLTNPKGAGRRPIHDKSLRHRKRAELNYKLFYKGTLVLDRELMELLEKGRIYFKEMQYL